MSAFGIEISEKCVCLFKPGTSKDQALDTLADAVADTGAVKDVSALRQAVKAREEAMSTGLGAGVAVPHVRIEAVSNPVLALGLSRTGIDFGGPDNLPARIIILFAMPPDTNKLYLGLLAQVMVALKNSNFAERLLNVSNPKDAVSLLNATGA